MNKLLRGHWVTEKTLQCEGHPGSSHAVNREWIRCDSSPGLLTNDYSAKHGGMVAGTKAVD